MGTTYTVGAKIIINYDQSEIKSTIERLQNFVKANPITINNIKIDSASLNNIKTNLEKLSIKLDNVSINNIKIPSNATKEIKSKIESISFKLGNLKLDTSKIDGKKIDISLRVPNSEITKLKEQIEGLRPVIKVQVQGQNTVSTPGAGSLAQAKTFADSLTSAGQYKGNTVISYDYDQAGKLIAVLKNAQNETIRLKYQFDEASKSFQQIGSSTKVPDLLNQSTISAQKTFSDLKNITTQFNVLKQQSGSNPIDFKTQKLIPDLEMLNAKLKTLSTGMQQVTQTYKLNDTQTMSVSGNYNMLRGQMDSLSTSTGNLANRQIGLGEATSVALQRFPLWIAVSTLVMSSLHKLQESFEFMSGQSKLFTNLQLEMSNTNLVFSEITNTANTFATEMGATTDTVMKAIAVFGTYTSTIDEVLTKSRSAVTLSNITGQGIEQTSDELMGVMTQYKITADGIEGVTDSILGAARMLQLDFPKAVSEISSGLRTVGSVAKDAGMDISTTTGILSTMIEVTRRSGSENSNALRTIISRISNVGEESNPEEFKGIEAKFNAIGVAIKSSSDTIRPMGDILSNLSEKWKILNDVERQSIATAAAGIYRRNAFISLMTNYDKVLQNTTAAQESEGVTAQKQEIYNNSLSASVARLTSVWEKFYLNSINTDTWKNLVKGLTVVISGFASFADVMGGIPTILATVVLTASLFSTKFQGFMSKSFLIAPMLAFKASVIETSVVMRQFSGYANTWRTNPFIVGFQMAGTSVMGYITNIRLAIAQQTAMGRTGWANALGVAITGISSAMRSLATSAVAAKIAIATFQAVATLGISVALSLVIGKVMEFADNMIHAKEKAKEAFDTIQKSISSLSSEVAQSETLISTYEELSAKKNKTTEETQSLAQATEKLSSLLPQSIEGFDSEGRAILGSADSLREYLDLKKQELELNKQKLVSDFYKNESTQIDDIIEKQNKLNSLKEKLSKQEQIKTNIIGPNNSYTPNEKVSLIADKDLDINKIKGEISEVQGEILKANSAMSSGLKAVTQTELESLNLSSTSLSNFSKSYMGIISKINDSGRVPSQVLSQLFNTFKSDVNIKPIIDEWNTSLEGLQKGNIEASKAEEIHSKAVNDLITAISRANPNMSMDIIKPFVEGLIVLGKIAPEAKEKVLDIASSIDKVNEATESYLESSKDLASTIAKMNDGHKLTTEELYKLIKAHPELSQAIVNENGVLTLNKEAIEKVMEANDKAFKSKLESSRTELENEKNSLLTKLSIYGQEIKAIKSVAQAKELVASQSLADPENRALYAERQSVLGDLQKIEDQIKTIGVVSQITPKDLIASANPDLNKKDKDKSPQTQSLESLTQATLAQIKVESALQKAKSDAIQKELDQVKSAKNYQLTLTKTNELIASQAKELELLQKSRDKVNQLKDSAISSSQFGDTSRWFVGDSNEESISFISEKNKLIEELNRANASEQTEKVKSIEEIIKSMDEEFKSMQILRNGWVNYTKLIKENTEASKELAKQSREYTISALKEQSDALSSKETSTLESSFKNLNIDQWIKDNITATSEWADVTASLQEEISKLGTPTTLAGQLKYNELLQQSAKLAADALKAEVAYAKEVEKVKQNALFESTDQNLQDIMSKIDAVDQAQQLSKGGTSSSVPKIDMEIVPRIDYKSVQEAIAEIPKPNVDEYDFEPPTTFVTFIHDEFTNAVLKAKNDVADLTLKINSLGEITPTNQTEVLGYYQKIQDVLTTLSKTASEAEVGLNISLKNGEISQEDFDERLKAIQVADLEVLAVPKFEMTADAQASLNLVKEKIGAIDVDANTKPADDKILELMSKEYDATLTIIADDIAAKQAIAELQIDTSSIHTIYVKTVTQATVNAKGTDSHPGGNAIYGEAGRELVELPNGTIFLSDDKATISDLPKGTKIYPNSETEEFLKKNGIPAYAEGTGSHITDIDFLNDSLDEFAEKITDISKEIAKTTKIVAKDNTAVEKSDKKIAGYEKTLSKYLNEDGTYKDKYVGSRSAERAVDRTQKNIDKETAKNSELVTKAESDQAILDSQKASKTDFTQKLIATQKALANLNSAQYIEQKINLYQEAITVASANIDELYDSIAKYKNDDGTYEDNETTRDVLGKIKSNFDAQKSSQLSIKQLVKEKFDAEYEGFDKAQQLAENQVSDLQKTLEYQKLIGASIEDQLATEEEILKTKQGEQTTFLAEKAQLEKDKAEAEASVRASLALVDKDYTETDLANALANSQEFQQASDKLSDVNSDLIDANIAIKQTAQEIANIKFDNLTKPFDDIQSNLETEIAYNEKLIALAKLQGKSQEEISKIEADSIKDQNIKLESQQSELVALEALLKTQKEGTAEWLKTKAAIDASKSSIVDTQISIAQSYSDIADKVIEAYKAAYKQQEEIALASIEKQKEAYDELIDTKIKALSDASSDTDYNEDLASDQKKALELQSKIDALSLDNSIEGKAKKLELSKQLSEQQTAIATKQRHRDTELQKNSLEEQKENNTKAVEKQIEITTAYYDGLINDEREFARIREQIYAGNFTEIQAKFDSFNLYFSSQNKATLDALGVSWQGLQKIIDQVTEASQNAQSALAAQAALQASQAQASSASQARANTSYESQATEMANNNADGNIPTVNVNKVWNIGYSSAHGTPVVKVVDSQGKEVPVTITKTNDSNYAVTPLQSYTDGQEYTITADGTVQRFKTSKTGSYKDGGIIDYTGIAQVHGSSSSPEVVFNASQASKLYDLVKSIPSGFDLSKILVNNPLQNIMNNFKVPDYSSFARQLPQQSIEFKFDNLINVEGNIDQSSLPSMKEIANYTINELNKTFNRNGVLRRGV